MSEGWHSTTSHNSTVGFVSALSNGNLITLRGFVSQHLWQQPPDPSAENGHHSLTTHLQGHWSDCQYCTYNSRNSLTRCYRHQVIKQNNYRYLLSGLSSALWLFILLFHTPGSTVILCSMTHFSSSSLLMLPGVFCGSARLQSRLNHNDGVRP